jgi:hypothetical protein
VSLDPIRLKLCRSLLKGLVKFTIPISKSCIIKEKIIDDQEKSASGLKVGSNEKKRRRTSTMKNRLNSSDKKNQKRMENSSATLKEIS